MAMKLIKSVQYDSTIDDVVEVLQNVFDGEAEEWERKSKSHLLSNQLKISVNLQLRFYLNLMRKRNLEEKVLLISILQSFIELTH